MTIALFIIAACEVIRLFQAGIQLKRIERNNALSKEIMRMYNSMEEMETRFIRELMEAGK